MCEALAVQSGSLGSCQVMKLLVLHSLRKPHLFCTTSVSHTAYIKMIAKRLCQHKSPCAPSACLQMHRGFAYPKSYRPSEALSLPLASRATKTLLSRRSFPGDVPQMSPPQGPAGRLIPAPRPGAASLPTHHAFWEGKYTTKISKLRGGLTFERPLAWPNAGHSHQQICLSWDLEPPNPKAPACLPAPRPAGAGCQPPLGMPDEMQVWFLVPSPRPHARQVATTLPEKTRKLNQSVNPFPSLWSSCGHEFRKWLQEGLFLSSKLGGNFAQGFSLFWPENCSTEGETVRAADAETGRLLLTVREQDAGGGGRQWDASFRECLLSQKWVETTHLKYAEPLSGQGLNKLYCPFSDQPPWEPPAPFITVTFSKWLWWQFMIIN